MIERMDEIAADYPVSLSRFPENCNGFLAFQVMRNGFEVRFPPSGGNRTKISIRPCFRPFFHGFGVSGA
ncbi:MAG: hypothetical protein GY866_33170 [Proteobacteria bacterium]|nr:hypothetical protein [Pseudomonadota bacterium]